MTRDELIEELETILIGSPKTVDVMDTIDSYVATERHEIEQQIAGHVETRVAAERERIAQAIEANIHDPCEEGCSHDNAIALAARIARAES